MQKIRSKNGCLPLKSLVPEMNHGSSLMFFRVIDDLATRIKRQRTLEEHEYSRDARFEVFDWTMGNEDIEKAYKSNLLDKLMIQVPGKNGPLGNS